MVYVFTLTSTKSLDAAVSYGANVTPALALVAGSCPGGTEIACSTSNTLSAPSLPPGTYYLWIENQNTSAPFTGGFTVNLALSP